jgi:hypothetical protein
LLQPSIGATLGHWLAVTVGDRGAGDDRATFAGDA